MGGEFLGLPLVKEKYFSPLVWQAPRRAKVGGKMFVDSDVSTYYLRILVVFLIWSRCRWGVGSDKKNTVLQEDYFASRRARMLSSVFLVFFINFLLYNLCFIRKLLSNRTEPNSKLPYMSQYVCI